MLLKFGNISAGLIALTLVGLANAQTDQEKAVYRLREDQSSAATKTKINDLRAFIKSRGYHFTVGATSKIDADIRQITGYVPPPNRSALIARHNQMVPAMLKNEHDEESLLNTRFPYTNIIRVPPITLLPSSYDWRPQFVVTKVKDQGQAGTCWAFASCSALESSDLIRNSQYACVSDQQAVTCSGAGTVSGGWPQPVLDFFMNHGATYEDGGICPYLAINGTSAQQTAWNALISTYYATAWDYVNSGGGVASTVQMKQAILAHGPILSCVDATYFNGYTGGVIDVPSNSVDHVIDIVGWDDSLSAFIVKNSWGHDWGISCGYGKEMGYCYVGYGDCSIGYDACWVDAKVPQPTFPWNY